MDVDPIPGTLVVNIGELLELASNGYLRATVHRVVTPPAGVERYSVPFFFSARLDATIPLLTLPEELRAEAHGPESDPDNPLFRDCRQQRPERAVCDRTLTCARPLRRPSGIRTENRRGIVGNFWKAYWRNALELSEIGCGQSVKRATAMRVGLARDIVDRSACGIECPQALRL